MASDAEDGKPYEKEHLYTSGTGSELISEEDVDIDIPYSHKRRWRFPRWALPYILHATILILFLVIFVFTNTIGLKRCDMRRAYSPAQNAVVTDIHSFSVSPPDANAKYVGRPSPALDRAWADLLQYSNIRFTDEEFHTIHPDRIDNAIKLPDGGYFGSLFVYHELHCLKHIYRFVYKEHYLPPLNETESDDLRIHIGHCIDTIRQAVLCHADITPFTMTWPKTYAVPGANTTSPHTCVSWDAVNSWARSRSIDNIFEPGYLKHPVFGDVYGKDFEDSINRKTGFTHSN